MSTHKSDHVCNLHLFFLNMDEGRNFLVGKKTLNEFKVSSKVHIKVKVSSSWGKKHHDTKQSKATPQQNKGQLQGSIHQNDKRCSGI